MSDQTEITEPLNSLGLLLSVAEHAANLPRYPARDAEGLAEKMAAGRWPINTDSIDQVWLLLRRDLRGGGGTRAKLRALVNQAHEGIYMEGQPLPTGRLSLEERWLLRIAMARHSQALRAEE